MSSAWQPPWLEVEKKGSRIENVPRLSGLPGQARAAMSDLGKRGDTKDTKVTRRSPRKMKARNARQTSSCSSCTLCVLRVALFFGIAVTFGFPEGRGLMTLADRLLPRFCKSSPDP